MKLSRQKLTFIVDYVFFLSYVLWCCFSVLYECDWRNRCVLRSLLWGRTLQYRHILLRPCKNCLVRNEHYTECVFESCSYLLIHYNIAWHWQHYWYCWICFIFLLFLNEVRLKCLHSTCLPIQGNQRSNRMSFDLSISNWLDECEFAKQCLNSYLAIGSHYPITCMEKSFQRKSKLLHFDCYDNSCADAAEPKAIPSGISHIVGLEKS